MQATIKRAPTGDRGPPESITVDILTNEQLGPRMSKLPNGSLLCRDVPIGRVGWMIYGPGEIPMKPGPAGIAYIERTADELFSPETIGSFMACTVTDGHPPDDVVPSNWKHLAKGFTTTNVRQGTGDDADVLLGDLIVTDKDLITSILAGKREVSLGYEADYYQTAPGVGLQTNIRGNHIALVEKGRCGPRCAIGDRAHSPTQGTTMTQKRVEIKGSRAAVDPEAIELARAKARDAAAELEALENPQEDLPGGVHVHIHNGPSGEAAPAAKGKTEDRMAAIETTVTELAGTVKTLVEKLTPATKTADQLAQEAADAEAAEALRKAKLGTTQEDDDKDPATGKSRDSAALADSYTKVLAQAEVLVPGFRMPTFDAAAKRKDTVEAMCMARRRCLDMAYATTDGQKLIDGIHGAPDLNLAKLDCAATAVLFGAAAGAKALMNNQRSTTGDGKTPNANDDNKTAQPVSFADINAKNREFWEKVNQANQPA